MEFLSCAFRAMGCPCELHLYSSSEWEGRAAVNELIDEALRFEHRYSRYRDDSIVAEINSNAGGRPVKVDEEARAIFDYADTCFAESDGLFDVTSGVFRRIWRTSMKTLPDQSEVDAIRALVGWDSVEWNGDSIRLPQVGMEVDLGGIVKEYAADALASLAAQRGVHHGLIDLGGDLRVIGPHADGRPWQVGITNPATGSGAIAVTQLLSGGIATSGSYERVIEVQGQRLSHIINAHTGWPVAGLLSASVLASQTLVAGSLSTIAMLREEAAAIAWLRNLEVAFVAVTRDFQCIQN